MNEVRLSGILQGVVEHDSKDQIFITASLEFSPQGHAILVVAAGPRVRELQPFDTGDHVRIIGRLVVFRDGFAVLVDEAARWAAAHTNKFSHDPAKADRTIREIERMHSR